MPHNGFYHQSCVETCPKLFDLAVGNPTRHPGGCRTQAVLLLSSAKGLSVVGPMLSST